MTCICITKTATTLVRYHHPKVEFESVSFANGNVDNQLLPLAGSLTAISIAHNPAFHIPHISASDN